MSAFRGRGASRQNERLWKRVTSVAILVGGAFGCSVPQRGEPAPTSLEPELGALRIFEYYTLDGGRLSSVTTRGRTTVILFVATYDLASQVVARKVDDVIRVHRPQANAGAVVLEPPKHAPLAEAFATSLELSYPVAMADHATRHGRGPFGPIDTVPTVIVLDAAGREIWRKDGMVAAAEIEAGLRAASGAAPGARR